MSVLKTTSTAFAILAGLLIVPVAEAKPALKASTTLAADANANVVLAGGYKRHRKRHYRLNPHQIKRKLRRHGFHRFNSIRRRGDVFVVRAHERRRPVKIVASAYTGEILRVRPIRRKHRQQWGHGGGHGQGGGYWNGYIGGNGYGFVYGRGYY
ncbi:MAG: hypothetical protein ABJN26_26565 [Stappiaceae bacterium]